jgi:hypothetical protein
MAGLIRAYTCVWRGVGAGGQLGCTYDHAKGVNPNQNLAMVLADGAAHWATANANTSQGPCHWAVVGRIAVPAARLVWAVVHGAVDDNVSFD